MNKLTYIVILFVLVSMVHNAQTDIPDLNQRRTKYILYNEELDNSRSNEKNETVIKFIPANEVKKTYHKNGQLAEVYYPDSLKMEFYQNGGTRSFTKYRNGRIYGERMYYYPNGQVEMMVYYKNGMQDGPFALFYQNGKIKYKGEFKMDHLCGERYCYDENGQPVNGDFSFTGYMGTKYEGKAINGKPEGEVKVSDEKGLIMTVNFKNGKAHGLAYHYKDGKKVKAENYAEGIFVDDAPF